MYKVNGGRGSCNRERLQCTVNRLLAGTFYELAVKACISIDSMQCGCPSEYLRVATVTMGKLLKKYPNIYLDFYLSL